MLKRKDRIKTLIFRDCRKAMQVSLILFIISKALGGIIAVYAAEMLGGFVDAVLNNNIVVGTEQILKIVCCIGISVFIAPGINLVANIFMLKNALSHDRMVRRRFFDKKYEDVSGIEEGEALYRLEDDPIDVRGYWVAITERVIVIPILLTYVLYNSIKISLLFSLVVIGVSLIKLIVPMLVKKLEAWYDKENRSYNENREQVENEIAGKAYLIKMWGIGKSYIHKMDQMYQEYYKNTYRKSVKCTTIANNASGFTDTLCVLVILLIGAVLVSKGIVTAGTVAAMIGYFAVYNTLLSYVQFIIRKVPILNNVAERMKLFYDNWEVDNEGIDIDSFDSVSAKQLSVRYEEKVVFQNLNFEFHAGQKVAVCGPNGSGKTTLLRLLCRLLNRYEGNFCVNGTELSEVSSAKWRDLFAYAAQDAYVFPVSIRENIRIGNLAADEQRITAAIEQVGLSNLMDREEDLSEESVSGGERQKISIARALVKDSPVLIMDEPSNNLDEETKEWLAKFISESKKTIIYVSHDDDFSNLADVKIGLGLQ